MKRLLWVLGLMPGLLAAQEFVPIHEIQGNRLPGSDTSAYIGQVVTTTGIAVTDVGEVAGSRVFFLEEAGGGPWSGIQVYFTSNQAVVPIQKGDSVVITGQVDEYYGNTEIKISSASDAVIVSSGHPLPPAAEIFCGYLDTAATSMYPPDSAEAYEGVLVQLNSVYVTSTTGPNNDWEVTDGTGYVYIRNNGNYTYTPQLGDNLTVRGPVRVYYGLFRIEPRSDDDITVHVLHLSTAFAVTNDSVYVYFTAPVEETSAENPANYMLSGGVSVLSATLDAADPKLVHLATTAMTPGTEYLLTVSGVQDTVGNPMPPDSVSFWGGIIPITTIQSDTADSGLSNWEGRRVTISGICTVDSTASNWYYIEEAQGGYFSGIMVYDYDHEPVMGDSVILVGTVNEYYGMTEIVDVIFFRVVSSGHPLPDPVEINTGMLAPGGNGEAVEGVLVQVDTALVVNPNEGGPYFEIDDGSGIARVGNRDAYAYEPHEGDTIGVTGVVRYVGGGYTIEPRSDSDFVFIYVAVAENGNRLSGPFVVRVPGIARRAAVLKLQLASATSLDLVLYDATGRRVQRVFRGTLQAGRHELRVPLKDLASGVYFLKVAADGFHRTYRLVHLR